MRSVYPNISLSRLYLISTVKALREKKDACALYNVDTTFVDKYNYEDEEEKENHRGETDDRDEEF